MRRSARIGIGLGMVALVTSVLPSFAGTPHDGTVANRPVSWTPSVQDGGGVFGVATVGDITVAGGNFTQVLERGAASPVTRNNIFAFDSTGKISTTFVPTVPNRVWDVIPAGDGQSVYVGGQFGNVNGAGRTNKVARINVNTGQVVSTFKPPSIDGKVMDLELANGKLYVGGYFKTVGGQPRTSLAALDPTTGADTGTVNLTFSDVFRETTSSRLPSGYNGVGVERFAMSPDGSRLVAIGNFRTVNGQSRVQVAVVDTSGPTATLADWSTTRFSMACSASFPTYTLGVDISPDGKYFVVGTGGAFNGGVASGTLCDSVSRFELDTTGANQQPTWVDYVGGDTTTAIHITGAAVYTGGHFRWMNAPFLADREGPGSVGRKGLSALDPRNGLPLNFNAGKLPLNWGVGRFVSNSQGLWVGHDGDTLGGDPAGRIGLFPLEGGKTTSPDNTGSLPGTVFQAGKAEAQTGPAPVLYRVNAGGPGVQALDNGPDWEADQGTTSPWRTSGSSTASTTRVFTPSPAVPASTPPSIFSTARVDPRNGTNLEWNFPVTTGVPLQVRLYFANDASATRPRQMDVSVENQLRLDNYDIINEVGTTTGTVKTFDIPAAANDGNVDIDFAHVLDNPLLFLTGIENPRVNGIEIVRTDVPPPSDGTDDLVTTPLTESSAGTPTQIDNGGIDWSSARGAFMVDGRVYTGWADGTLRWRPLFNNDNTFGTERVVDLYGLTEFAQELPTIRAMWFDRDLGRLYYVRRNTNQLYYRYFTPESSIVGAVRFTPTDASGIDWGKVRGGFLANGRLYFSSTDGSLKSVGWAAGGTSGTVQDVSGPAVDGVDWNGGPLFLQVR
ncbi:malectin domain-containing carbohydrate-binding protein [Nocardioides sp. GXQ0305]|uniref:malectin domain-containing carbohydrate-binding protein n=1 Tax=Nocardioides sp. GXQ0305 TaxID=3423912 RepID=UPI003D7DBA6F